MTALEPAPPPESADPGHNARVVVKKYANRRLYNTETSSYITLDNLAEMVREGRDFVVYDARSGEDITRGVLTQIIVEAENRGGALLPTEFLRQLIGCYGDNLNTVVPRYLEQTMAAIARQQQQMRNAVDHTMEGILPAPIEEFRRQNVAMVERAMSLFSPFYKPDAPAAPPATPEPGSDSEVAQLRNEVERLRAELASRNGGTSGESA